MTKASRFTVTSLLLPTPLLLAADATTLAEQTLLLSDPAGLRWHFSRTTAGWALGGISF